MAASSMNTFVQDFIATENFSDIQQLKIGIDAGKWTILEVVESLGAYLTATDKKERCKAVNLLKQVIANIRTLSNKEAEILFTFYCDRLKDHYSLLSYVLDGTKYLVERQNVDVVRLARALINEVPVQSLNQRDRYRVLTLIETMLINHTKALKVMDSDFVYGFIQAVDGEKDPRNLMTIFRCVPVLAVNFNLGVFKEELFEVVACYFPVDFNPPPNDQCQITGEDLSEALKTCLTCTSQFAEFALPLFMDKLGSVIPSAKEQATRTFELADFYKFKDAIWSEIKSEFYGAPNESFENASLSFLTALSKLMSKDAVSLKEVCQTLVKDCHRHLVDATLRLQVTCSRLLSAVASGSSEACAHVTRELGPILCSTFNKASTVTERTNTLQSMLHLLKTWRTSPTSINSDDVKEVDSNVTNDFYSIMLSICSADHFQLRCHGISGLVGLLSLNLLSTENIGVIALTLLQLCTQDGDISVRKEALAGLTFVSQEHPECIMLEVLPQLTTCMNDLSTRNHAVMTLIAVSSQPSILKETLPLVLQHLEQLIISGDSVALAALYSMLVSNIHNKPCRQLYMTSLLPWCYRLSSSVTKDSRSIELMTSCVRVVSQNLDTEDVTNNVFTSLLREIELHISQAEPEDASLLISQAVLCSFPPQVAKSEGVATLLKSVMEVCVTRLQSSRSHCKLLAALVNKATIESDLKTTLKQAETELAVGVAAKENDVAETSLHALSWLTKSLLLRGHTQMSHFLEKILEQLNERRLAATAADAFFIMLHDFDDVMSASQHATIRVLHKQRLFVLTKERLVDGFHVSDVDLKKNFLVALSYLVRYVPKPALQSELPKLLPLLARSLTYDEADLQLSALNSLYDVIQDSPHEVVRLVDDVIDHCLSLTRCKHNMRVRKCALQCVGVMSTLDSTVTSRYSSRVLKALAAALDDRKRLVRLEATKARNEWFLLETSTET